MLPPRDEPADIVESSLAEPPEVASALANIWRRHFGRKGAGTDGHILSMTIGARRLLKFRNEVETELGVSIPFSTLMKLGTFPALLEAIKNDDWPQAGPLVLLRDGDPGKPLYVVSAGGGIVLELCDLVALIDFPGRIWALQLPGIDGEATPIANIEEIARYYLDRIANHGEKPPYALLAYSFGGLVAVEMARLLHAAGTTVRAVLILDTVTYEKYWPPSAWLAATAQRAILRMREMRKLPRAEAVRYLSERCSAFVRRIRRRLVGPTSAVASTHESIYFISGLEPEFERVRDASIVAFESHNPKPIDFKVVLFKSTYGDPHACNPIHIWRRLARDLDVVIVPGTHLTMIRKSVAGPLANHISQRLS